MENFVSLLNYDGNYLINKKGKIFSIKSNKILKSSYQKGGYENIVLCKDGFVKQYRVHRLVAETFIPNPLNKEQVNHIDGNKKNNNVENLEWCTASENGKHKCNVLKIGLPPLNFLGKFGINHNKSKSFWIEFEDGTIVFYGSGLEYNRKTGFDHTLISYVRNKEYIKKGISSYKIKLGSARGLTIHFINPHYERQV